MAILERTHQSVPSAGPMRTGAPAPTAQEKRARLIQNLPIITLALVACVSVGYGFGTLVQFDRDWRETTPALIASAEGTAVRGAPLAQVVVDLLAQNNVAVTDINCADSARFGLTSDGQMCLARGESGMVSILATGSGNLVHVEVFGTA